MKNLWTGVALAATFWTGAVSAEYCNIDPGNNQPVCVYKTDRLSRGTQIVVSYTPEGWTMLFVVYRDEFAMIEGDARVEVKDESPRTLNYISTHRDMQRRQLKESALYRVDEAVLRELASGKGKFYFYLANTDAKEDLKIKVSADEFEHLDAFMAETKSVFPASSEQP